MYEEELSNIVFALRIIAVEMAFIIGLLLTIAIKL